MIFKRIILVFIVVLLSFVVEAQYFNHVNSWKTRRREFTIGGGLTNYIGDLGGLNKKGTNIFLIDLEFSTFKYGFYGSYRYNISHRHASSLSLFYGKIYGSDQLTNDIYRNNRNLSFSSHILELTWSYEFYIIRPQPGHLYNIEGAKGLKPQKWDFYFLAGVGAFYHNPKAHGTALRFIGTEGQGLPGGKLYYNLIAFSFPVGFGGSYYLSKSFKIGIETSYRWTSTDYLDDVSTNYYGKEKMAQYRGENAAYLSDPSSGENPSWTAEGEQRGDPTWRDGFMSLCLKVTYMPRKKTSLKTKRRDGKGSRTFAKGSKQNLFQKAFRK